MLYVFLYRDLIMISAISEDQKSQIRKNLISAVSNGDSSVLIARQQSIAIAKIARIDFPNEWPNLFEELLRNLSNCQNDSNSLLTHLYTLHQVVKTLCSIRISRARENFQHVSSISVPKCVCYNGSDQLTDCPKTPSICRSCVLQLCGSVALQSG